ncbi:GDSL-type esterase/lipase family protein [Isosphaeraceae bacterium EP7]
MLQLTGLLALLLARPATSVAQDAPTPPAAVKAGDRVAWIGSSSTNIGVWPRTVEFLLRTRHPSLKLEFKKFSTGGGTFATGLANLDAWLNAFPPTLVVFNYGGNDAGAGRAGLANYLETMGKCIDKARAAGARVILVTPQAADTRKSGVSAAKKRTLYAETMLEQGRLRGWPVVDIHHPLETLQLANQKINPSYSILKDKIHLTDPAYVAWGFLFFDRLNLPLARSEAAISADGRVVATVHCAIEAAESKDGVLAFTRIDEVLPLLPPGPLPPRHSAPLEAHSRYLLQVEGLSPGNYEIRCEGRQIGVVPAETLSDGLNLNTLLLDDGQEAPWTALARDLWEGRRLEEIGKTRWRFEIRRR